MIARRSIRRGTKRVLEALGDDLVTVASTLDAYGARGTPRSADDCVVARYLGAVLGADPAIVSVAVWQRGVRIRWASRRRRSMLVPLPRGVAQFIAEFDAGRFPQLIARPGRSRRDSHGHWEVGQHLSGPSGDGSEAV